MTILGFDFKGAMASAFGSLLLDCTLTKTTPGTPSPSDPTAGSNPTSVSYTCKGTSTKLLEEFVNDDQSRNVTFEAIILLGTMSAAVSPNDGDTLTVPDPRDHTALSGVITKVDIDPDGASAICTCLS